MESLLGLFLKGVGWSVLWPQLLAMAAISGLIFGLSLLRFGRQIT